MIQYSNKKIKNIFTVGKEFSKCLLGFRVGKFVVPFEFLFKQKLLFIQKNITPRK